MAKKNKDKLVVLKKISRYIQFLLLGILLFLLPSPGKFIHSESVSLFINPTPSLTPTPQAPPPVNTYKVPAPYVSAESYVITDLKSGSTLDSKNENKLLFPASTTKVMTALVVLDKFDLDDVMTVKTVITEGSKMNLVSGETLTVESLLYGALVHSANDAAFTLAENYPGGVDAFVVKMNEKADEIGLSDTHFTNPIGFDDPRHYTTSSDLTKLSVYALKNKIIDKISSTKSITVSDTTFTFFHKLDNVNQLLGKVAGISGLKTGYTENAGEILISTVKKNGHTVLFAVMKSKDRFGETVALIDWVFNNFTWQN